MSAQEDSLNAVIGHNVQRYRQAAGNVSQTRLAAMMTEAPDLDQHYSQQTILKIENGSRPLKAAEAVVITHLLDVDVRDLLSPVYSPVAMAHAKVVALRTREAELKEEVADVRAALSAAKAEHRAALEERKRAGDELEAKLSPRRGGH